MVATFERISVYKNDEPSRKVTHLDSLPLKLPSPPSASGGNGDGGTFDDVVRWPEETRRSSFTFKRQFPTEATSSEGDPTSNPTSASHRPRYVPQLCPIQISVARPDGRLHKLGDASVFVSGEEDGRASASLPLTTDVTSKYSRSGGRSKNDDGDVSLMKLKGDTLRCGVAERATLRVIVRVWDPAMGEGGRASVSFEDEKKKEEEVEEGSCWSHLCCF